MNEKGTRELEEVFELPAESHARAAPRHRVVFVVWTAVFPSVLAVSSLLSLLPFEMPLVLAVFVTTAISVPTAVYLLLPRLCRLFEPWIYREPVTGTGGNRDAPPPR